MSPASKYGQTQNQLNIEKLEKQYHSEGKPQETLNRAQSTSGTRQKEGQDQGARNCQTSAQSSGKPKPAAEDREGSKEGK